MKRKEQLHKLSHEHHSALVMAKRIANIAEKGNKEELAEAISEVEKYIDEVLEQHFQHEEQTIFAPIFKQFKEHVPMATLLLKEHGYFRMLPPKLILDTAKEDLAEFAIALKNHTRVEERELFPIVESLFSDEQMDAILNFVPLD